MKNIRSQSKNQELVRERRRSIAVAGARVLVTRGYAKTSTAEIAEACGMSKGGLYHYIGSKKDVLYLIIEHSIDRQAEVVEGIRHRLGRRQATDSLRDCVRAYIQLIDEDQDLILFVNREIVNLDHDDRRRMLDNEARIVEAFRQLLDAGVRTGEFREIDTDLLAYHIVVFGQMWAVWRWFLRDRYTLEEYTGREIEALVGQVLAGEGSYKPEVADSSNP